MSASELFRTAFRGGGGTSVYCQCGRTHTPEKGFDAVTYALVGDLAVVDDCPCNGLARLEQLIWGNRIKIIEYLTQRQAAMELETNRLNAALKKLSVGETPASPTGAASTLPATGSSRLGR